MSASAARPLCPTCRKPYAFLRAEARPNQVHQSVYVHADGRRCTPLSACERYLIPCSACGATLAFIVIASPRHGETTTSGLACACGARWKMLQPKAGPTTVYVTQAVDSYR